MSKNPIDKLSGFCVITGASSGIGFELAILAARDDCDLLLVADQGLDEGASALRDISSGTGNIETLESDLATQTGIDEVIDKIAGRQVDVLMANAGQGEGDAFFNQDWMAIKRTIDTNITGTVSLIHKIGGKMRAANSGRILVTGSIVDDIPGPFNLVYNSTKAFVDDFCVGLSNELNDSNVVVSCLLPGLTDTQFFERADMQETYVGRSDAKADPAKVAKDGYDALLKGETQEVSGLLNKVQHAFAGVLPDELLAQLHRMAAKP
ncbi:SDR family oxidoreductase [Erythrobacter sp. SD-21]|uniref:SDR family NAD(P)-dependent oxidoreductase n=1 Tax=Erythrobacter sp. SD-21 TaxID=161528 RepID=UPI000153F7CA|nr:SDR family NAD(P)-dependent oxidoreductase [Erythrobacter sp. SD-21]EDL48064.1 putative short chain oxidoreductase protein [Erythrobacter sp. SD-21]